MIKIKLTDKGFYGCFWPVEGSSCAMIAMIGDDCEDHLAKAAVKWFQKNFKINVMTLSPEHKNYGHSNIPVERIGAAMDYMKARGIDKFGIAGASSTGMFSLVSASYYPEITLTIAMSASDFVMEGFHRGKRDGYVEWPGEGESTLSWQGKPLPYLPYAYRHPEYGRRIKEEAKEGGDMAAARKMFDESERLHPLREEEKIKVENIKGRLLLIGAEDDVLWDTVRYMRRMEERLSRLPHDCELEMLAYEHGTHFVFPEGLIREILPLGGDLMTRLFKAGRDFPRECKATRIDIEKKVTGAISAWKAQ
jgi:pimeloyl-ACP methyl ester carboxylesterase